MMIRFSFFFGLSVMVAIGTPTGLAHAQERDDQTEARKEMQAGNIMRSRQIEARVLPMMRDAEYLGFAYDSTAMAYRLKFIRSGRVIFVDVDARTGRILSRSR